MISKKNIPTKPAEWLGSYSKVTDCPKSMTPEFAFIGRSNVGKSSLINYLFDRRELAFTSSNPGKTQSINIFDSHQQWMLADLPGYGFARTSKVQRAKWEGMVQDYLRERGNLALVFLLIDASVPVMAADEEFVRWLAQNGIPFAIVFTKTDKASENERKKIISDWNKKWTEEWEILPTQFLVSVKKKEGKNNVLSYIAQIVKDLKTAL
jgi:GTP-binding protein